MRQGAHFAGACALGGSRFIKRTTLTCLPAHRSALRRIGARTLTSASSTGWATGERAQKRPVAARQSRLRPWSACLLTPRPSPRTLRRSQRSQGLLRTLWRTDLQSSWSMPKRCTVQQVRAHPSSVPELSPLATDLHVHCLRAATTGDDTFVISYFVISYSIMPRLQRA